MQKEQLSLQESPFTVRWSLGRTPARPSRRRLGGSQSQALLSPTVLLPHGPGEQPPLRHHGGQQPAHTNWNHKLGCKSVQAHRGLVRLLPSDFKPQDFHRFQVSRHPARLPRLPASICRWLRQPARPSSLYAPTPAVDNDNNLHNSQHLLITNTMQGTI